MDLSLSLCNIIPFERWAEGEGGQLWSMRWTTVAKVPYQGSS